MIHWMHSILFIAKTRSIIFSQVSERYMVSSHQINHSIRRMAETSGHIDDFCRKRCITPTSEDARIVVQKMEDNSTEINCESARDSEDCESLFDPLMFVEEDLQKNLHVCVANTSNQLCQRLDVGHEENSPCLSSKGEQESKAAQNATNCFPMRSVESCSSVSESPCDEGMDVGDVASEKVHKSPEIITPVKVSRTLLSKLKAMADEYASKLAELNCEIRLPRKPSKPVEIVGSSEENVQKACLLLKTGLVDKKSERPQLTHFVSIRLNQTLVRERFAEFRAQVRELQPDKDLLPDRLFQRPEKLHMTLSMLSLPDEAARQMARDVVEDCCRELRDHPPLDFRLRGLGAFGSATRARVLFSRPDPAERLQTAAELVHGRLCDAGLAQRQKDGIMLHATLLNTTFLTRGAAGRSWRKFRGFDHVPIMERLDEFDFGDVQLEALEISSLTEKDGDGYYASIGRGLLRDAVTVATAVDEGGGDSCAEKDTHSYGETSLCPQDNESASQLLDDEASVPPVCHKVH